ncbi:TetR/AcrR family transcriptional regulator [Brevibacterium sp. 91QC2O2]|uniref:TetR/AcrR family transcriptional regulator n=1 Tax=Brevibacterium TaxID=1696 RepID=UPI00211BCE28|nr:MULTISPECIES: TetR/AcrR family transcriptional regulator [unclassified Brevibacterium]MCQ9369436.1 TetR/AcrR family transcriptional regulator [Brevibacterium sp. 91QC2O2]MCQ9386785.1 TetR/AcrR family transcriptional regulator [Brevibacterium sp. 68QC2CO]
MPTRKEQQAQTRRRLINAAMELFARDGVGATSLNAVAEHAGFSRGAVHGNFAAKEELAAAVRQEIAELLEPVAYEVRMAGPGNPGDRLRTCIRAFLRFAALYPEVIAARAAVNEYLVRASCSAGADSASADVSAVQDPVAVSLIELFDESAPGGSGPGDPACGGATPGGPEGPGLGGFASGGPRAVDPGPGPAGVTRAVAVAGALDATASRFLPGHPLPLRRSEFRRAADDLAALFAWAGSPTSPANPAKTVNSAKTANPATARTSGAATDPAAAPDDDERHTKMKRTYRMTVRGRFTDLTEQQRQQLRAEQDDHDMLIAQFTPEGMFMYPPDLGGYQFRYLLVVDEDNPADADVAAQLEAEERAASDIVAHGLAGRIVKTDLTCVEDVKVRKSARP